MPLYSSIFVKNIGNVMRKSSYLPAMALFLVLAMPCVYAHTQHGEDGKSPSDQRPAVWRQFQEKSGSRMPFDLYGRKNAGEHHQQLSPEERQELRRDIRDAGRKLYQTRP